MAGDDNVDVIVNAVVDAAMAGEEEVEVEVLEEGLFRLYAEEQTMMGVLAQDQKGLRMLPGDW